MVVVPGPEKMNNTCGKTIHMGMMDGGFTVCLPVFAKKDDCSHNLCLFSVSHKQKSQI
jgi:hypothetical protein